MNLHDPTPPAQMPIPSPEFAGEAARVRVVESFEASALEDDPELQAIVDFAARLCEAPVSMVTLLDETTQHFLARTGIDERTTAKEDSFCVHTLGQPEMLEVVDATADERFVSNPLVISPPSIRFYAGQPLVSDEGASLGTLCVVDTTPRKTPLNQFQRDGLAVLAQAAMRRLNARREGLAARRTIAEREERLRRMIDGVPQIAWSADEHGNFDYFNKRWAEITGIEPPRVGKDWIPVVHPDDVPRVLPEWERCFEVGEEFETEYRLRQADGSYRWVLSMGVPVAEREGDPIRWFGTITDIDESHRAFEERDLLAKELSHRIKNVFAVVIGLVSLKVRKTPEHAPFAGELSDILRALGRAHEFVRPTGGAVRDSLHGLLEALFAPYHDDNGSSAVRIVGADAEVAPRAATPLALVFHELATNAAKYGALSVPSGHVTIDIEDRGETVALVWREHGGPRVEGEGERGFGSRLVEMSVSGQLQGSWERHFEEDGLVINLTFARAAIADEE